MAAPRTVIAAQAVNVSSESTSGSSSQQGSPAEDVRVVGIHYAALANKWQLKQNPRKMMKGLQKHWRDNMKLMIVWVFISIAVIFLASAILIVHARSSPPNTFSSLIYINQGTHNSSTPGDAIVTVNVATTTTAATHTTVQTVQSDAAGETQTQEVRQVEEPPPPPPTVEESSKPGLPKDFHWKTYLKWNADARYAGAKDQAAAEKHFLEHGHEVEHRIYADFNFTLRYTACGGLFNQQYSHLSALTLATLIGAKTVIWPPMQERASFAKRFNPNPRLNAQTWKYLDASTVWDIDATSKLMEEQFGIKIVKHHADCQIPNMVQPQQAYQECPSEEDYDVKLKYKLAVYLQRHQPYALAYSLQSAAQRAMHMLGHHPSKGVLIDMPCTLFMLDNRNLYVVEEIARSIKWAPLMQQLADKVVYGLREETRSQHFNGIHLRMERDAADWARIMGGQMKYWKRYKQVMRDAGFKNNAPSRPLYIASGLLKSSKEDEWSQAEMSRLTDEIMKYHFASAIVFKEKYLSAEDLKDISNEQSGLIDFLVLQASSTAVGIGVSTFSFYLQEARLIDGYDPEDTALLMLPYIGTDELFFSAGIAAILTRDRLTRQGRLNETCLRPDREPCFSDKPARQPVNDVRRLLMIQ